MDDHTQNNRGDRVIANQSGPQYANDGDVYENTGSGLQNNAGRHSFTNPGNGTQNNANNYGSGTQNNYFQQMKDLYRGGLDALKQGMYPEAAERFKEYLTTADKVDFAAGGNVEDMTAHANVLLALGLLNGSRPSYHSIGVIRQVEKHLVNAREQGYGRPVAAMADTVLAVVKEDFYDAREMHSSGPRADELRRSLVHLDPEDHKKLALHLGRATSDTWKQMIKLAREAGYQVPDASVREDEEKQRVIAPDRQVKVTKYFTRTPDRVSPASHMSLAGGSLLLLVLAIAVHNPFSVVLVGAAAWIGKKGYGQYKKYQQFLKKWEAAEPKPDEKELDAWLEGDSEYIKRKGARKLQLQLNTHDDLDSGDLITEPVVIVGVPGAGATRTGRLPAVRTGKDGQVRANHYNVLVLYLTKQVISSYRCILEFATGDLLWDETRQYHYGNIVGVSSESIPVQAPVAQLVDLVSQKQNDISTEHRFTLSIVNGEKLQVTTSLSGAFLETSSGKIAWRGNDYALSIIQSEVRSRNAR